MAASFAMFTLYFKYAGPESFGMLWILFAAPIILIISLVLLIIGGIMSMKLRKEAVEFDDY